MMDKSIDGIKKTDSQKTEPANIRTKDLIKAWLRIFKAILRRAISKLKKHPALSIFAVVLALALYMVILNKNTNSSPIPKSIGQSVGFPIYYPSKLPNGYSYEKDTVKVDNGIVFFELHSSNRAITLSEQSAPANPPDLDALTKPQTAQGSMPGMNSPTLPSMFQKIDNPAGQAVQGTSLGGKPVAIILTDTTLINISGSDKLTTNALTKIVKSLHEF
jgi:hypothetical protein